MIFLSISYPAGRVGFAYAPPPTEKTPLVLQVFNPTFWIMVELWLGIWAANLPPCAPLLRRFHPYQLLTDVYKRTAHRLFSSRSASNARREHLYPDSIEKSNDEPPSLNEFQWNASGHLSVLDE